MARNFEETIHFIVFYTSCVDGDRHLKRVHNKSIVGTSIFRDVLGNVSLRVLQYLPFTLTFKLWSTATLEQPNERKKTTPLPYSNRGKNWLIIEEGLYSNEKHTNLSLSWDEKLRLLRMRPSRNPSRWQNGLHNFLVRRRLGLPIEKEHKVVFFIVS